MFGLENQKFGFFEWPLKTSFSVQMHADVISKLLYGLYACMGDNQRAKARRLSSHTDIQ